MRLIVVLLLAAVAVAGPEDKLKARLAKVWVDYARSCVALGSKTEGLEAIRLAREAYPEVDDIKSVLDSLVALTDDVPPNKPRAIRANKDAAKVYDKLAKYDVEYMFKAIEIDPTQTRVGKAKAKLKQLAGKRQSINEAGKFLTRLRELDPKGRYDDIERAMALKDVTVLKASGHPLVGYMSLPKGWKKSGRYDVFVAVDGAGSNFLNSCRRFAKVRGSRPVIVLAPCTLTNTNKLEPKKYTFYTKEQLDEGNRNRFAFDLEGLNGLLQILKERYGANDKIAITGFSGGGNLCYGFTIVHPDRVLCAAPACANFSGMGTQGANPVTDGGPPVHIMTGAKDPHRDFTFGNKNSPGIEPQTDNAVAALTELGFKNVRRTMLKAAGHSPLRVQAFQFYDEVAEAARRR